MTLRKKQDSEYKFKNTRFLWESVLANLFTDERFYTIKENETVL